MFFSDVCSSLDIRLHISGILDYRLHSHTGLAALPRVECKYCFPFCIKFKYVLVLTVSVSKTVHR